MKTDIKSLIVLLTPVLLASFSFAKQREVSPVTINKLSDNLHEILGGRGAQGGAYIGDDGVLVVDAKMDRESVDETIANIKGLTDKPIKYLVNTHSDGDHVQGNQYFPETVTIIAHENCRKEFFHPGRDGTPSQWNQPELGPFIPSVTFRDKMDIYLGSKKVELWHFGVGHTTGDAVIYFPEEKTAFLGDLVFMTRPQLIHSYKGGNSFRYVNSMMIMLETLDAVRFCSGHSEMIDREAIRNHIDLMKKRQEKVRALRKSGKSLDAIKTAFEENETGLVETIYNEIGEDW
ncbi:MAG: MBL fold metallo-hydrolase [Candidatus Neomarinimicrobiota bacterium]